MENQTQNVREIQKRIRLLEKAERDLDALFRKERLVIAALESERNSSMHRSTKDCQPTHDASTTPCGTSMTL
jgi:hypothetical protein